MFGRKKKADVEEIEENEMDGLDELEELDEEEDLDVEEDLDEWEQFDLSQDWREDGPFDIDEVDLGADEVNRIDLGTVIITPETGMSMKLIANPDTKEIFHVVVENDPQSLLQITVLAAPSTGSFCAQIREDFIAETPNAIMVELVKGPFGTELRRILSDVDEKGRETHVPLRDWLISGPRWILNARFLGKAASEEDSPNTQALKEFVHNIIVRRGDVAMMPGAALPLTPREVN